MFAELMNWLKDLDRDLAFLLVLPFLAAAAGLRSVLVERRKPARAKHRSHPRLLKIESESPLDESVKQSVRTDGDDVMPNTGKMP